MKFIFQLFILLLLSIPLKAQFYKFSKHYDSEDSTQIHILETYRGDIFRGRVDVTEPNIFSFVTEEHVIIRFRFFEVRNVLVEGKDKIKTYKARQELKSLPPQIIFFNQTAFSIPKGVRSYQNISLWWNSFDLGLGKHFSVRVASLIPFFWNIGAKYSYKVKEKLHAGLNLNMLNLFYLSGADVDGFASFTGTVTFGNPSLYLNLTTGLFVRTFTFGLRFDPDIRMVGGLAVGGEIRRFVFKTEVTFYQTDDLLNQNFGGSPSFALGWKSKKRSERYHFGLIHLPEEGPFLPYISMQAYF